MRYQQQKNSPGCLVHKPQCLPTLLKVHHAISDEHTPLVVKDLTGLFEADAVLALIGEVLRLVPFETNSAHYSNIITYMALCNRGSIAVSWIMPRTQVAPLDARKIKSFDRR